MFHEGRLWVFVSLLVPICFGTIQLGNEWAPHTNPLAKLTPTEAYRFEALFPTLCYSATKELPIAMIITTISFLKLILAQSVLTRANEICNKAACFEGRECGCWLIFLYDALLDNPYFLIGDWHMNLQIFKETMSIYFIMNYIVSIIFVLSQSF